MPVRQRYGCGSPVRQCPARRCGRRGQPPQPLPGWCRTCCRAPARERDQDRTRVAWQTPTALALAHPSQLVYALRRPQRNMRVVLCIRTASPRFRTPAHLCILEEEPRPDVLADGFPEGAITGTPRSPYITCSAGPAGKQPSTQLFRPPVATLARPSAALAPARKVVVQAVVLAGPRVARRVRHGEAKGIGEIRHKLGCERDTGGYARER
jgi:hypothetical protein